MRYALCAMRGKSGTYVTGYMVAEGLKERNVDHQKP